MKYKVGDKFVLTVTGLLGTEEEDSEKGLYKVEGLSGFATESGLDNMERLDIDYVTEHFSELQEEAYDQGLSDAWEAARKINCLMRDGGLSNAVLNEIFGSFVNYSVMAGCSAREALNKITAYENEKDVIKVGDVVRHRKKADIEILVTCLNIDGSFDGVKVSKTNLYGQFGSVYMGRPTEHFIKTDKHFDIGSKMAELREKKHE